MALIQTRLVNPTTLTTSISTVYTVAAGETVIVKQLLLCNILGTAGGSAEATVYLVPNGQTRGNQHKILSNIGVFENETTLINLALVMTAGDKLDVVASAGSALNLTLSGIRETT